MYVASPLCLSTRPPSGAYIRYTAEKWIEGVAPDERVYECLSHLVDLEGLAMGYRSPLVVATYQLRGISVPTRSAAVPRYVLGQSETML
jgi:hypothetical protein